MDTSPRTDSPTQEKISSAADAMLQLSSSHIPDRRPPPSSTSKKSSAAYNGELASALAKLEQGVSPVKTDQSWRNSLAGMFNVKNENLNACEMAKVHREKNFTWAGASMDLSNSSEDMTGTLNTNDCRNGTTTVKDMAYMLKRQKNNEAAKRSREKRRLSDHRLSMKCKEFAVLNEKLNRELTDIKSYYGLPLKQTFVAPKPFEQLQFHNQGMMPSHPNAVNQSLHLLLAQRIVQMHNKQTPTVAPTTTSEQNYCNRYEERNGGPVSVQPPTPLTILPNNCNPWSHQDMIAEPKYANTFLENGVHSPFADTPSKIEPMLKIPRPTLVEDEDDVSLQSTETHSQSDSCETVSWKSAQDLPVNQISPIERRHTVTTCDWSSNINRNGIPHKLRFKHGFFGSFPGSDNQSEASFQSEHNMPGPSIETPGPSIEKHEPPSDMMTEPFQPLPSVNMQLLDNQDSQISNEYMSDSQPHSPESCCSILTSEISSSEDAIKYAERRWKNNLAAKKCRDQKKAHVGMSQCKSKILQVQNDALKNCIFVLNQEVNTLKELVDKKNQARLRGEAFLPPPIEELRRKIEQNSF